MDLYSRKVLSYRISNTADCSFCVEALERYGTPAIFNSDQGSQFTESAFREILEGKGIRISMDGKGRAFDNIVIERFWRTLKYSDIYLRDYESPILAVEGISRFIEKYNTRRPHDSLRTKTPDEIYFSQAAGPLQVQENQRKIS